ncbi:hypothetical protein [Pallidibacillus pasinlerensis]|uniref:Uncharacterized protein n=1 Tax=Pallidibacillus pasinlerensis TaxID=2703818 RepID=A0ABW9ZZ32_9BACI|nr:hypothetical protein [Pallidibacillus pasinlerensis]NCU16428.1 hypothetical protein [Pallidibacillus pasinlerensis]
MYRDNRMNFDQMLKAIETAYEHLQNDESAQEAIQSLKEAEQNIQQAINFNLSAPIFRTHQ